MERGGRFVPSRDPLAAGSAPSLEGPLDRLPRRRTHSALTRCALRDHEPQRVPNQNNTPNQRSKNAQSGIDPTLFADHVSLAPSAQIEISEEGGARRREAGPAGNPVGCEVRAKLGRERERATGPRWGFPSTPRIMPRLPPVRVIWASRTMDSSKSYPVSLVTAVPRSRQVTSDTCKMQ